jgi:DNA-directed RNA polymerase subunit RPC12/RpoP
MRLELVNAPPDFSYKCLSCGRRYTTANMSTFADLDGEPFKAYYCFPCHPQRRAEIARELHTGCKKCGSRCAVNNCAVCSGKVLCSRCQP